jgi:hypothetical protein
VQKCEIGPDDEKCMKCTESQNGCYWGGISRIGRKKVKKDFGKKSDSKS